MVSTSSVVLPEPGLETRFSASTPAVLNMRAVGGGVGVVFGEQILLDFHDAGFASPPWP